MKQRIIQGPNAYWHGVVIGQDIEVRGVLATNWGDAADPEDSGQTANGLWTKNHPDLLACSLPLPVRGFLPTQGTPLPHLPWGLDANGNPVISGTQVIVTNPTEGISVTLPLIDNGPALKTNHAIDLTDAAFEKLGGALVDGIMSVNFLIKNGAAYL